MAGVSRVEAVAPAAWGQPVQIILPRVDAVVRNLRLVLHAPGVTWARGHLADVCVRLTIGGATYMETAAEHAASIWADTVTVPFAPPSTDLPLSKLQRCMVGCATRLPVKPASAPADAALQFWVEYEGVGGMSAETDFATPLRVDVLSLVHSHGTKRDVLLRRGCAVHPPGQDCDTSPRL